LFGEDDDFYVDGGARNDYLEGNDGDDAFQVARATTSSWCGDV